MKTFVVEAGKYDDVENAPTVSYSSIGVYDIQEALKELKQCASYPWAHLVVMIDGHEIQTFTKADLQLLDLI